MQRFFLVFLFLSFSFSLLAVNTVTSADSTMTMIAGTSTWYVKTFDSGIPRTNAVGLWLQYNVGNGTSVTLTFQFAKTSIAPTATDLFGFPERQYDNSIAPVTIILSSTANNYLWLEVPATAMYAAVTVTFTGGTTQTLDLSAQKEPEK